MHTSNATQRSASQYNPIAQPSTMAKKGTQSSPHLPKSQSLLIRMPYSKIPHDRCPPRFNGANRLLQDLRATAPAPSLEHVEIRSRWYVIIPLLCSNKPYSSAEQQSADHKSSSQLRNKCFSSSRSAAEDDEEGQHSNQSLQDRL